MTLTTPSQPLPEQFWAVCKANPDAVLELDASTILLLRLGCRSGLRRYDVAETEFMGGSSAWAISIRRAPGQSSALGKLIRSVAAAGLWSSALGKGQGGLPHKNQISCWDKDLGRLTINWPLGGGPQGCVVAPEELQGGGLDGVPPTNPATMQREQGAQG